MKLIVQIPCFNEEKTLPLTLRDIPRQIPGVDEVEVLVIDDGSVDRTAEVARQNGVDHVVRFAGNKGLAVGFMAGLDACLKLGADLIVNTDADNQYSGKDIGKLLQPILEGRADMVIGNRDVGNITHFSFTKKKLQKLGSWVIRHVSDTDVPDATSGFRAFNREAALKLNVLSDFTYTLETIIQAGIKNITVDSVTVRTNEKLRESRLFKSVGFYISKSIGTIIRIYTMYQPLRVFTGVGGTIFSVGVLLGIRFLYYYFTGSGAGHVQSVILSAVLSIIGFQIIMIGLLADIIAANRRLLEEVLYRMKKSEAAADRSLLESREKIPGLQSRE
jgi:glycosyltransferase involved in cell wall biosynthesis